MVNKEIGLKFKLYWLEILDFRNEKKPNLSNLSSQSQERENTQIHVLLYKYTTLVICTETIYLVD